MSLLFLYKTQPQQMLGVGFFWIPVKGMDFAYVYLWVKDKTTSVRTERNMSMLTV